MNVDGLNVIVTGAASGMGRAIANKLTERGASCVIADLDGDRLEASEAAARVVVDITDIADVRNLVDITQAKLGSLDAYINCAGIAGRSVEIENITDAEYDRMMAVNVLGTLNGMRAALPLMKTQASGSIVNFASIAAQSGFALMAAYSASKAAVVAMTRSAALESAHAGVRINAICPGFVDTPMNSAFFAQGIDQERFQSAVPVGRPGDPAEIAELALFLASPSSSYITGQTITADGGWSVNTRTLA